MKDFFGYNREIKPNGAIATVEFANLYIGSGASGYGGRQGLVQQCQWGYSQNAQPRFEAGSPTLYWLTGQPSGTVGFGRLVASSGLFDSFDAFTDSCGKLIPVTIALDGNGGCSVNRPTGSGKALRYDGSVVETVGGQFGTGAMEISESATLRCASLVRG